MGKFILTNSENLTSRSVGLSKSYGYELSGKYESGKLAFACYHKLSIENENFIQIGDDFVSVIGTVIYKDRIGKESMQAIYKDFTGNVNAIRDHILGNGAFIIKKDDIVTIFCEYFALYHVFYTFNNENLIVSNDLADVCRVCEGLEVDYDNLVLKTLNTGMYGHDTEVKNVYNLQDFEVIEYDVRKNQYKIKTVEVDWRSHEKMSQEELVRRIGDFLKTTAASLYKHFGDPLLSSTGGLDNRLNMAALFTAGSKPDLFYGIGNSPITNTNDGDLAVDKMYEDKFGLHLKVGSWRNAEPIDKDWKEIEDLYGFLYTNYGGSKDFNDSYRNIKNKLILFGALGEIYRLDDNTYLEDIDFKNFTLDKYIDMFAIGLYYDPAQLFFKDIDKIHDFIKGKLKPICEKWSVNPSEISPKDDIILQLEHMRRADTNMMNLMNRHHFCTYLFAPFQVLRLVTLIEPELKSNACFHLSLLKYLSPEVLEIPIYSRAKFWEYDENTNTMRLPRSYTFKSDLLKYAKKIVPPIVDVYYRLKPHFAKGKKHEENVFGKTAAEVYMKIMEANGYKNGVDYEMFIRDRMDRQIAFFAQELNILKHLGVSL